jgi:hypothetical protein
MWVHDFRVSNNENIRNNFAVALSDKLLRVQGLRLKFGIRKIRSHLYLIKTTFNSASPLVIAQKRVTDCWLNNFHELSKHLMFE